MPLTPSPAPATTSIASASHSDCARPKPTMPTPQPAAARVIARPLWCTRADQPEVSMAAIPPTAGRRPQQADHRRPAVALRERREERERHPEEHRVDVDHVGAEQLLARGRVLDALEHAAQARRLRVRRWWRRAHQREGGEREHEGADVDRVRGGHARRRDDHPGQRGPSDLGDARQRPVDRGRGLQLVALDQPGEQRVQRWSQDGLRGGEQCRRDVEHPQLRGRDERVDQQRDRDERGRELGAEDQPPAVEGVGQRAADERQHDDRDELGGAQQADGERGVGEGEDLHEQGDLRERAAQQRDRVAADHQPQVAAPAQQRQVGEDHCRRARTQLVRRRIRSTS